MKEKDGPPELQPGTTDRPAYYAAALQPRAYSTNPHDRAKSSVHSFWASAKGDVLRYAPLSPLARNVPFLSVQLPSVAHVRYIRESLLGGDSE